MKLVIGKPDYKSIQLIGSNGKILSTLRGHTEAVKDVSFAPDVQRVASSGADNTVRIWGLAGTNKLQNTMSTGGRVTRLAISPDGQIIASAGIDNKILLWNQEGKLLNKLFCQRLEYRH
jgi:WD40 repeat protein